MGRQDDSSSVNGASGAAQPAQARLLLMPDWQRLLWRAAAFWGVEDAFQKLPGVYEAISGYTGGHTVNPSYEDVCRGDTGHAEAVLVRYDPSRVTYEPDFAQIFGA